MSTKSRRPKPTPPAADAAAHGDASQISVATLSAADGHGADPAHPFVVTIMIENRTDDQATLGFRSGLVFARSLDEAIGGFTRLVMASVPGSAVRATDGFEIAGADQQRIAQEWVTRLTLAPAPATEERTNG